MRGRVSIKIQETEFRARHLGALELNEAKHNLLLNILGRPEKFPGTRFWSLGEEGACALHAPSFNLLLGDLKREHCEALADELKGVDFPGIVGPGQTVPWLAAELERRGKRYVENMPQGILRLDHRPEYPNADGLPREATIQDRELVVEWFSAFQREAIPEEVPFTREQILLRVEGRYTQLWCLGGKPVATASESRRLKNGSIISAVYTLPEFRGRGFGGSVVAALSDWIFSNGQKYAALYTDLRNPVSNRVYERIGFRRVAESFHYLKAK